MRRSRREKRRERLEAGTCSCSDAPRLLFVAAAPALLPAPAGGSLILLRLLVRRRATSCLLAPELTASLAPELKAPGQLLLLLH